MPRLARSTAAAVVAPLLFLACSTGDTATTPSEPPAVSLALGNATQRALVGQPFTYDATRGDSAFADPVGGGLQYTVTLVAPGLVVTGRSISGTPLQPGVFRALVVATDARGATARDSFAVVVFTPGLAEPQLPSAHYAYSDASNPLPQHFFVPAPGGAVIAADNSAGNPTTDAGATLGRVLFHDRRLSINDAISCSSCHVQAAGFADTARLSTGFAGGSTGRHSMGLTNARFYQPGRFFWDERAATLEAQVVQPIQDATEMGMSLPNLVAKLSVTDYYAPLFTAAFGTSDVTADRIARALAQYVRSLSSRNAKFDSAFVAPGPPNFAAVFTEQEREGHDLFVGPAGCARCHVGNAQVGIAAMNIGLDSVITDVGAGMGRFKPPSLRNVAVRGRYMHDGRFTSLEQVVDHYDSGVRANPALDQRLRLPDGRPQRLGLRPAQKAALVAYLRTLTDHELLTAVRFSDPFGR